MTAQSSGAVASGAVADMESLMARTALRYDLLPYQSNPFPQSQPARLAGMARLFGLEAVPVPRARVLELGCASGGNILPLAATFPDAHFTGVDLSRTQVAAGRARIDRLGLGNVEILCKSFTEIGPELGLFDYIICHGVYSWVPAPVRRAILAIISRHLSPTGVGYVSFNVLPGWRVLQPLRDAFLNETRGIEDSRQRVAKCRQLLEMLNASAAANTAYGTMLKSWAARLPTLPDDYIEHEFLAEINEPCLMRDFAGEATANGLAYLGDTELPSMILDNQGRDNADRIRALAGNDLIASEHYMDMVSGRTFRQSLVVKAERQPLINRALSPLSIEGLHFLAPADLVVTPAEEGGTIGDSAGRQLVARSRPVVDAIALLAARFPASASIDELVEALPESQRSPVVRDLVAQALFQMAITGLATLSSEPVRAAVVPGDHPVALAHVRSDAAAGAGFVCNARHERCSVDAAAIALLPLLDGTQGRVALAKHLAGLAIDGKIQFSRDGAAVTGRNDITRTADEHLGPVLDGLARAGLLAG